MFCREFRDAVGRRALTQARFEIARGGLSKPGGTLSAKRPSRRYIGFRFEPPRASRKDVGDALERAWRAAAPAPGAPAPRLLVCEGGMGILVVPTPQAALARKALAGAASATGIRLASVVSSGTIAAVKRRMLVPRRAVRTPK